MVGGGQKVGLVMVSSQSLDSHAHYISELTEKLSHVLLGVVDGQVVNEEVRLLGLRLVLLKGLLLGKQVFVMLHLELSWCEVFLRFTVHLFNDFVSNLFAFEINESELL
jgi:hypothetical protein